MSGIEEIKPFSLHIEYVNMSAWFVQYLSNYLSHCIFW